MTKDELAICEVKSQAINAEAYHARARNDLSMITSSGLKLFRKSPAHYRAAKRDMTRSVDTDAFRVGRALHTLTLEPAAFDGQWLVGGPVNKSTGKAYGVDTKAYREWAEAEAGGRGCLTPDEFEIVQAMAESARGLSCFWSGLPERTFLIRSKIVIDDGLETSTKTIFVQVRPDWLSGEEDHGIVDLKSCDDIDFFEYDYRRYQYAHQNALYHAVALRVTEIDLPVHVVAVEKNPPYRAGIWRIKPETLAEHRRENSATINELAACIQTNTWPTRYESERSL